MWGRNGLEVGVSIFIFLNCSFAVIDTTVRLSSLFFIFSRSINPGFFTWFLATAQTTNSTDHRISTWCPELAVTMDLLGHQHGPLPKHRPWASMASGRSTDHGSPNQQVNNSSSEITFSLFQVRVTLQLSNFFRGCVCTSSWLLHTILLILL